MPFPIRLTENHQTLHLHIGENKLTIQLSDITTLTADAIVCPVNQNMDTNTGVAKIIIHEAGRAVRSQKPHFREPFGKVVVLPGGKLNARYIFMTVLIGERGLDKMRLSISQAVDRAIRYGEFLRIKSIAFPVMGSTETLPPYDFIARQMLENVFFYFQRRNTRVKNVIFSIFNADAFDMFKSEAQALASQS